MPAAAHVSRATMAELMKAAAKWRPYAGDNAKKMLEVDDKMTGRVLRQFRPKTIYEALSREGVTMDWIITQTKRIAEDERETSGTRLSALKWLAEVIRSMAVVQPDVAKLLGFRDTRKLRKEQESEKLTPFQRAIAAAETG